jgi:hypothetical protein
VEKSKDLMKPRKKGTPSAVVLFAQTLMAGPCKVVQFDFDDNTAHDRIMVKGGVCSQ